MKVSQYSGQAKTIPCDIIQDTLQQEASHLLNRVRQECLLEHISDLAKHHHSREREAKKKEKTWKKTRSIKRHIQKRKYHLIWNPKVLDCVTADITFRHSPKPVSVLQCNQAAT